jgi:tetratricopeptide (TPR) repeat protein
MLRVHLAGSLRLESGAREIPPPRSRRARSLLAYLAAYPGPHARGELAARFWPDVLDESARTSLRAALTELRRALGPEAAALVATRDTVALDGAWVDVRDDPASPDGELLPGMDDEWVHELRREHAERVALALDELAAAAEQAGDVADGIRRARAAVERDPLLESARDRLARLTAAGAEHVVARIAPPPSLSRTREETFTGRAAELARLAAGWHDVRSHSTRRLMLIAGEPGVGKTRLALRFAGDALGDGATVLLGRCSEDPLAAFEPFADVLRQIGVDAARSLAGPGAAELDRVLGHAHGAPPDERGARHRLFAAVDDVLTGVAERRPLLLILDDLHWADRPTLLLLAFVLRSPRRAPLLAVGTYRDTEIGRRTPLAGALAELRRDGGAERIALRGLDAGEVAELVAARVGSEEAARLAGAVHARTGGNAYFVEEVLRGLAEGDAAVPESVRHAVGARLARLSEPADELAGVAAVVGQTVDPKLVAAAAGRPPREIEPLLDELLDGHLLRAGDARGLEFPHALVREAVLADLSPLRRARLHRAVADALAAQDEDSHLEEIAHHLSEAGDDRAGPYLRRAGDHALAMLAYEEAAELYARALDVADTTERGALLTARGEALLRAGEPAAARACFADAAALARTAGDPGLLGRAALGYSGLGVTIIDLDEAAVAVIEESLAMLGDTEPVLRSELLARLAVELYYAPSRDRSEAFSAAAVEVARTSGDLRAVAAALNARHVALWRPDRLAERLATAGEMIQAAREAGDQHLELQARNWRVADLFETLERAEWRAEVRRHAELAARLRMPGFTWYTPLWAAVEAVHAGRWDEGAEHRERAREEGRRAGDRNADLFAEMLLAAEIVMRGAWESADLTLIEEKIATSPAGMAWRGSYAWFLAAMGRPDEAHEQLAILAADDFAALPFDANWASALGEGAEACALLNDADLAPAFYDRLLPYAERGLTAGRAVISYGATQRLLAGLAAARGRPDEAAERHRQAIDLNEAAGLTVWADHGRRALAALRSHPSKT